MGRCVVVALFTVALITGPASAFGDPDWPCVQRKVPQLSVGQVWAGPPLPGDSAAWRGDPTLSALVGRIAARRTGMTRVEELIGEVAAADGQSRDARLVALFAGVFQQISRERRQLIEGISRYAVKQRDLAAQIDDLWVRIEAARAAAGAEDFDALDRIEEMEDKLRWDTRIYQDRQKSLTYVCESPVILDQRAFAVARMIAAELGKE